MRLLFSLPLTVLFLVGCSHDEKLGSAPSTSSNLASTNSSDRSLSATLDKVGISQYPGSTLVPDSLTNLGGTIIFRLHTTDSPEKVNDYYIKEFGSRRMESASNTVKGKSKRGNVVGIMASDSHPAFEKSTGTTIMITADDPPGD